MTRAIKIAFFHRVMPPVLLFIIATGLRLALVISARDFPTFVMPIMDMQYHDEWARAIVGGNFWGDDVFFRAPLYPYFLAGLYAISGGSIIFARIVQAFIGGGSAVICYFVGLEVFRDRKIAFIGAALLATIWTAVYFDVELLLVVLEIPFNLAAVLFLLKARDGRVRNFALAGLFAGLSAITRPNILAFALFVWFIYLLAKPRLEKYKLIRGLVVFYTVIMAVVLPVTVRNYVVGDDFVLISAQGGVNLYIGNNPRADGATAVVPGTRPDWWGGYYDAEYLAEVDEGRELKPSEVDKYYFKKTLGFFSDEPLRAAKLMLWKAYLYTNAQEIGNNFDNNYLKLKLPVLKFDPVSLNIILPFAFLGMGVFLTRFREYSIAYIFTIIYSSTVVLFFINDKFRMPVVPFFCLFAAAGFFWLWEKTKDKELKRLIPAVAILAGLFVYCCVPPVGYSRDKNLAQAGATIGMLYQKLGRYDEAERELRRALELNPDNPQVLLFLGNLYLETGRRDLAAGLYEKVLSSDPNNFWALANLGVVYAEKGEVESAYAYFERSLDVHPRDAKTLYLYARALDAGGRRGEAIEKLRLAVKFEPNFKAGYALLGELADARGDLDEAERAYKALLDLDGHDPVGTLGLAQTLHKKGDYAEAEGYYKRYLKIYGAEAADINNTKYNLACCLAMLGKEDEAVILLADVVESDPGRFRGYAAADPELASLRDGPAFKKLITD